MSGLRYYCFQTWQELKKASKVSCEPALDKI